VLPVIINRESKNRAAYLGKAASYKSYENSHKWEYEASVRAERVFIKGKVKELATI
jgi:hypothetical protein